MNLQQFLDAFEQIVKTDEFETMITNDLMIRSFQDKRCYCPITLVCQKKVGVYVSIPDTLEAADALGLDDKLTKLIITAADGLQVGTAFVIVEAAEIRRALMARIRSAMKEKERKNELSK